MKRPIRVAIWLIGASIGQIALTLFLMVCLLILSALLFKSLPNLGGGMQLLLMLIATIIIPLPTSILLYNIALKKLRQKAWFRNWLS